MPSPRKSNSKAHSRPPGRRTVSLSRELIVIDQSEIKKVAQNQCREVYKKIEGIRRQIEQHEAKSVPEFQNWLQSTFREELNLLHELNRKVNELEGIVDSVNEASYVMGCSKRQAYSRLMEEKARYEELQKKREEAGSTESFSDSDEFSGHYKSEDFDDNDGDELDPHQEELLLNTFEMLYGSKRQWRFRDISFEDAFEEFKAEYIADRAGRAKKSSGDEGRNRDQNQYQSEGDPAGHRGRRAQGKHMDGESEDQSHLKSHEKLSFKEMYRHLARMLHPDVNQDLDSKKTDLWHQVQDAYESQNFDRLKALYAFNQMLDRTWDKIEQISTLKQLFLELTNTLRDLEHKVRHFRNDESWKFQDKLKNSMKLGMMKRKFEKEMTAEKKELSFCLRQLEATVQEWSSPKKQQVRPKPKRRHGGY